MPISSFSELGIITNIIMSRAISRHSVNSSDHDNCVINTDCTATCVLLIIINMHLDLYYIHIKNYFKNAVMIMIH